MQQPWREDASNQDMAHTRNRIRCELLPLLRTFNPQIAAQLARLASISADEEAYWQGELSRLLPPLLLPGRPTRGGGRSASTHPEEETVAMEQARLRELHPAVARRVLRAAARRLGPGSASSTPNSCWRMAAEPSRAGKFDLPGGITVERSLREIRLTRSSARPASWPGVCVSHPGRDSRPRIRLVPARRAARRTAWPARAAVLRPWKAGDRVTLRHSRGPKKVAEVLDRLHVVGGARKNWPVVEWRGEDRLDARGRSGCARICVYRPIPGLKTGKPG